MRTAHLDEVLASEALSGDMQRRLRQKRSAAVARDGGAYIEPEALYKLAKASTGHCPDCGVEMLYAAWAPYCLRQVSLDRLDDALVHAEGNVRLCCYACNVAGGGDLGLGCRAGCHAGGEGLAEREAALEAARQAEFESALSLLAGWLEAPEPLLAEALSCPGGEACDCGELDCAELGGGLALAHRGVRGEHKRERARRAGQPVGRPAAETPAFPPAPRRAGPALSRGCGVWGGVAPLLVAKQHPLRGVVKKRGALGGAQAELGEEGRDRGLELG